MEKEQLIKDIVFVGSKWESCRDEAECKLSDLITRFTECESCKSRHGTEIFWVIEEIKSGFLIKRYDSNIFSVCSLKCLFDRGLNKMGYYSVVARQASGEVKSTGFQGQNAVAIRDFAYLLNADTGK